MKRTLLMLVLVAFGLADYATAQQALERAEAPVYKDGGWWEFKAREYDYIGITSGALNGTYKVLISGNKVKTDENAVGRGAKILATTVADGTLEKEIWLGGKFLEFPLLVGKGWSFHYLTTFVGGRRTIWVDVQAKVTAIEIMTTPTGTFRTFKIERYDQPPGGFTFWKTTYFYSPEAKAIVKFFYDSSAGTTTGSGGKTEIELVKFGSRAPGAPKGN